MNIAATAAIVEPKIIPPTVGCPRRVIAVATAVSKITTNNAIHCPRFTCSTLPLQILSSCLWRCFCSFSAICRILSADPGRISSYPFKISGCGIGPLNDSCNKVMRLTTVERSSGGRSSKDSRTLSAVGLLSVLTGFIGENICLLQNGCPLQLFSNRKPLPQRQTLSGWVAKPFVRVCWLQTSHLR